MAPMPRSFPRPSSETAPPSSPFLERVVLAALALSLVAAVCLRLSVWPAGAVWSPVVLLIGAAVTLVVYRRQSGTTTDGTLSAARTAVLVAVVATLLAFPLVISPTFAVGLWCAILGFRGRTAPLAGRQIPLTVLGTTVMLLGVALRFFV